MRQPTESLDDGRIEFEMPPRDTPCFDPVCGRRVNAEGMFTPKLERDGKQYAFCSAACQARFKSNPDSYKSPQMD